MKCHKLLLCAVGAILALCAVFAAAIIFKNELIELFVELKDKFDGLKNRSCCKDEFSDYADI